MGFAGKIAAVKKATPSQIALVAPGAKAVDRRIEEVKILKAFAKQAGWAFVFRRAQLFPAFLR
jgi:hypothetical protein